MAVDAFAPETLRARIRGELIVPADSAYERVRRVWNAMIDKRPALIVRCAAVADVITTVNFARDSHLPLAVRGGGHTRRICSGLMRISRRPANVKTPSKFT